MPDNLTRKKAIKVKRRFALIACLAAMFLSGAIQAYAFFITMFPVSSPGTPFEAVIEWWPETDHSFYAYSVVSCLSLPYLNGALIAIIALLLWGKVHNRIIYYLMYVVCGSVCVVAISAAAVITIERINTTALGLFFMSQIITGWFILRFKDERNVIRKAVWVSISTMIPNVLILYHIWNVLNVSGMVIRGTSVGWYCGVASMALLMVLSCSLFSDRVLNNSY
jgi:hypothetical protein